MRRDSGNGGALSNPEQRRLSRQADAIVKDCFCELVEKQITSIEPAAGRGSHAARRATQSHDEDALGT